MPSPKRPLLTPTQVRKLEPNTRHVVVLKGITPGPTKLNPFFVTTAKDYRAMFGCEPPKGMFDPVRFMII